MLLHKVSFQTIINGLLHWSFILVYFKGDYELYSFLFDKLFSKLEYKFLEGSVF